MKLDRTCIKCEQPFTIIPKPYLKPTNVCYECKKLYQRTYANKKSKVIVDGYKEKYPIPDNARRYKFNKIQKELAAIRVRSEWQAYLKDKLDNLDPAIIKWIWDRRDQNTLSEDRDRKNNKEDYEDTRRANENKSWFD